MNRLLIIRFSALGDVAMTVPVITSLANSNQNLSITILTQKRMVDLFSWMPANVTVIGVNLHDYHGISGLNRLFQDLKTGNYDFVADLHDVLRTKYLRTRFRIMGTNVAVIRKGRADRKALIGHGLNHEPLKPVTEKYAAVFKELGMELEINYAPPVVTDAEIPFEVHQPAIGIAPFAAHQGKVYPLDLMQKVVDMLADGGNQVFLFGAGREEASLLEAWEKTNVTSTVGKCGGLKQEMCLMSRLQMMISMDSSNMHMAALMGTRTISVWGATHPKAGFTAWNQPDESIIQIPMDCRPCSIYGSKPCKKGNYPCMREITPEMIVDLARKYGAK